MVTPFGFPMETDAQPAADPPKDRKTYNGIEHFPMMEMGLAHYRTLDAGERGCSSHVVTRAREKRSGRPAMLLRSMRSTSGVTTLSKGKCLCGKGRWLQAKARLGAESTLARLGPRTAMSGCGIDPKSEKFYALTPYNSMGGNPVSMVDPDGDLPFLAVVGIGALVGTLTNGVNNISNGQGFFQGAGKAALWGAVGGAVSFGIGSAASGLGSGLGKAAFQMGAHGYTGGFRSKLMGGDFGSGFLSGALSSGMSSGAASLGIKNLGMVGIGGLSGGIGSSLAGGSFWGGVEQGLLTSGLNHAAHVGASAIEANIHVKAARAFMEDLGHDPAQVAQDVVTQSDGFFGKYYAKLNKAHLYIGDWTEQVDSRTGGYGYVSKEIKGYQAKYYGEGRAHSIGLIRTGAMHYFEAGMEFLDGAVRNRSKFAVGPYGVIAGPGKGVDNVIYDMHGRNSRGYLNIR